MTQWRAAFRNTSGLKPAARERNIIFCKKVVGNLLIINLGALTVFSTIGLRYLSKGKRLHIVKKRYLVKSSSFPVALFAASSQGNEMGTHLFLCWCRSSSSVVCGQLSLLLSFPSTPIFSFQPVHTVPSLREVLH